MSAYMKAWGVPVAVPLAMSRVCDSPLWIVAFRRITPGADVLVCVELFPAGGWS